ncbi:YtfJ family protein [Polyangium jinanense]|uniref:Thioredoxin domain-containing protein n=1 Tax=Polyangium jinanense TaxID=2829994 RepID=A0A9X3X7F5_9BACT|nr:YtfJ family protein [Polyangium jinanense]MDC3961659.1 hypothetical protein [Polyangium jinanense]MDC3983758.1 hypothetical protein [Polyangium jinanense]
MIIARRTLLTFGITLLAATTLPSATALAVLSEQSAAPNARVEDADGKAVEIKSLKGKPIVIVYDDRTSAPKSEAFRRDLVKLLKSGPYASKVSLLLVADVSPYDFWPARGSVKDAVREETKKQGTTVYCDWTGGMRSAYKLKNEITSVVMVGKDGKVMFAKEGVPAGADQKRLVDTLKAAVEGS